MCCYLTSACSIFPFFSFLHFHFYFVLWSDKKAKLSTKICGANYAKKEKDTQIIIIKCKQARRLTGGYPNLTCRYFEFRNLILLVLYFIYSLCIFNLYLLSNPVNPFSLTGYTLCSYQMRSTCVQLVPPQKLPIAPMSTCCQLHVYAACVSVCVCVPWPPLQLAFIMPVDNFRPHIWTMRICREFYALLLPFLCVLTCVCVWA